MSIASEISRLQSAKADLKTAINAKTDAQHQIDDETLDHYAGFVDSIQTGGDTTDLKNLIQRTGTTVTIPNDTTSIGGNAFRGYTSLTSITFPSSVTSIGTYAFTNCTGLTDITIPSTITSIGAYAFSDNNTTQFLTNLANINYNSSAASLSTGIFKQCGSSTNEVTVTIGNSVTRIGEQMFAYITKLKTIVIPDNVTSLGASAFQNCTGLTTATIGSGISNLTHSNYIFDGCTALKTLNFNCTLTSLPSYAALFRNAGQYATGGMTVNIGDNVTKILQNTFQSTTHITTLNIGSGITEIAQNSFPNTDLTTINITATTPPTLGATAFNTTSLQTINVPSASLTAYQTATNWSAYSSLMVGV